MSFYQQTGAAVSGADHRRKWDTNEYQAKANERLAEEKAAMEAKKNKEKPKGPKPRRELLQARDEKVVDLESKVGKQVTINKATATEESGGFYCELCECSLKDSINYLDHINGKNHQHKLGYSMKVKRSTVDDVVNRFAAKKAELLQKSKKKDAKDEEETLKEEQAKMADSRRQKHEIHRKRQHKEEEPAEEEEPEDEMAQMMGFGGFSTTKKPR
uniref:U1-type domain-containing protein n=1 Tax=Panagrolaimus sp. ES5 TaxID=591445 RepID=A0AC34F3G5_9BILA